MGEADLADWVGRKEVHEDRATETPARALAATLDRPAPKDELPALWSWLYFLPLAPMSEVGADGHPKRGGFLPPVSLPRRMWAGSRCTLEAPLRLGAALTRSSTILKVSEKEGRAGPMVFVTVAHEVAGDGAVVMREEQDIVYMGIPERFTPPEPQAPPLCEWRRPVAIDPVMLFRFSALTFNGHRIHYDRPYTMDVEKYPGLVVHGPLQAMLLFQAGLDWAPGKRPGAFSFRGVRPVFDFDEVLLLGRAREGGLDLFTVTGDGAVGMQATLDWRADGQDP
jgi:3-methylfumaryl-CoA hydratase